MDFLSQGRRVWRTGRNGLVCMKMIFAITICSYRYVSFVLSPSVAKRHGKAVFSWGFGMEMTSRVW